MANTIAKDIWNVLTQTKKGKATQEAAIIEVLDLVLKSAKAEAAFDSVMLANNAASMTRNVKGVYAANINPATQPIYALVKSWDTTIRSVPVGTALNVVEQALAEPNIAGIPISAAKVETDRNTEVSESMVIVQSTKNRKYWTDNAVPRLKEWSVEGYLTVITPLDSGCLIKPSLQWQAYYLDVCAKSRRPVLFKTNRGEFVKVQITNLHTLEEAAYNNAIHITMSLKEYNPYIISSSPEDNLIAIRSTGA